MLQSSPNHGPMTTADFLKSGYPDPTALPEDNFSGPSRFFNRELSWLAFNWRVLEEAQNSDVPLLERVRFLAISADNLDEFFTVRVAGLRELARSGRGRLSADGLSPAEQLELINKESRALIAMQDEVLQDLVDLMAQAGLAIVEDDELTERDEEFLESYFISNVFPVLSPLAVDPAHPFPFIPNGGFALALQLELEEDKRGLQALLPIPAQIDRFVMLPSDEKEMRFFPLEDLLIKKISDLFPGYKLSGKCAFRVLRDSDLEVEDEAEDLVREFEVALKRRRRGEAVRLTLSEGAPNKLKRMILASLEIEDDEVIEVSGMIGLGNLDEIVACAPQDLLWRPYTPRVPERVQDYEGDMFAAISQKDMLLHHPYETFDMVVRFLAQAAHDPDVVAIKQTLYRTSNESSIVDALCEAAESGKSVTALVELKARFDEAANIRQARKLERAGAHVIYGFINYKTHAKISTVVRREGSKLVTYTHFGTGNYHPITAKFYTDLSFFTCDAGLGRDATKVFNYVGGYAQPDTLENLFISPNGIKQQLIKRIRREAAYAKEGKPAEIWAKMNSLVEPDVIDALYEASQAGVKICLIVRGICGLRPGIAGLSENIRVKSIIGRFLEHSRIVCFGAGRGLPSKKAEVYMSSADWMGRNLNRRVETLVRLTNKTVHAQVMSQIMAANLADTAQSWILRPDGSWEREPTDRETAFNCHKFFMENSSLSGRGSAGASDVPKLTHSID